MELDSLPHCPFCNQSFDNNPYLEAHVNIQHPENDPSHVADEDYGWQTDSSFPARPSSSHQHGTRDRGKQFQEQRAYEETQKRHKQSHDRAFAIVYADRGTPYPVTQATLNRTRQLPGRNKSQSVSPEKAISDAIAINERRSTPAQRVAADRILAAVALPTEQWEGDLIIKVHIS